MTEPRKCPEPGCGREMEEQLTRCIDADGNAEVAWVCPATPDQHELAALRARKAELETKLDEAHKREVVLREALVRLRDCDWVITLPDRMDAVRQIAREALDQTPESATAWLKAHDREVLEKAWQRVVKHAEDTGESASLEFHGYKAAILEAP